MPLVYENLVRNINIDCNQNNNHANTEICYMINHIKAGKLDSIYGHFSSVMDEMKFLGIVDPHLSGGKLLQNKNTCFDFKSTKLSNSKMAT